MNHYTIADIRVGMSAEFSVTVTEEKMTLFHDLTGDCNPLHTDEAHAKAKGYRAVTLNVWSCNVRAQKFYERLGLQPQRLYMEAVLGE